MWALKLNLYPSNVVIWLQDIRKTVESYEELRGNVSNCGVTCEGNSSNDSIYDNVTSSREKPENTSTENTAPEKKGSQTESYTTWPLRRYPATPRGWAVDDFGKGDTKTCFCSKGQNPRIIHFNCLNSELSGVKHELHSSDIIYKTRRCSGQSRSQEGEEPKLCASMSNLLAGLREKHTRECAWTWLNAEEIISDGLTKGDKVFSGLFHNTQNVGFSFESRMTFKLGNEEHYKSRNFTSCRFGKSLTGDLTPTCNFYTSGIFDSEFITEKPPVPPKRRKRKMSLRQFPSSPVAQSRRLRKTYFAKMKPVSPPTLHSSIRGKDSHMEVPEQTFLGNDKNEVSPNETNSNSQDKIADNELKKPLPFPAYDPELEYEISELLMMQRVTESSKERRKISVESKTYSFLEDFIDGSQGCIKNIPEAPPKLLVNQLPHGFTAENVSGQGTDKFIFNLPEDMGEESQNKVKQFLDSRKKKLKYETKPKASLKLREDIIIDWENDYENLSEPIILEGKSILLRHLQPKEQISTKSNCFGCSKELAVDKTDYSDILDYNDYNEMCSVDSDKSSAHQPSLFCERCSVSPNSWKLTKANTDAKVTDIVTLYDKILKEADPKFDAEVCDRISVSSISDGLNSYSDFESDINETIAAAEMWYNERSSEENGSVISWDVSEDVSKDSNRHAENYDYNNHDDKEASKHWKLHRTRVESIFYSLQALPQSSLSEGRLGVIAENEDKLMERSSSLSGLSEEWINGQKWVVKSFSEENLRKKSCELKKSLSKSLDFFRDALTENRLKPKVTFHEKHDSITSDVCEWMAKIRGIAVAEDQLFSNDDEWILSFDSEEKAYFFEETSKKSLWALPDYSKEPAKPEYNYSIQRSATESAIRNEISAKSLLNKDGSQTRISASTRSAKTQSMLIEPKFDLSPKDGSKTFSMPRNLSKIYGEILRIGVLNKTKISENGKKLRKNWTPSFVVLTESYLFFFKDAKSFQNIKNVISSSVNHLCLNLQGAVIEKGDKISSRKNVYKISCADNTEVLMQTDKICEAEEWFKEISTAIQRLPQDLNADKGSPLLDSKSPSKVGRTKSLKVRSKDTGSMEDLSSTPEERQNKIKARLKKFFIRRPTVDSLKKKGIWKDEPVFGCSLEQITKNRNPRVPVFVEKCIECIESKEENMKTDGLYRASGNLSQVQKIRLEVDQNNLNIMKEEEDVHVLTGSLKLFFRELKEPLIPSKQLEPALLATDKHSRKEKIKDFQKIVRNLPTPNYDTLKFLLQHLLRVKEFHKFNRMNINNLAIVFGPTLMWPEQESANMALELMQQNVVIECLLKEFQEIFT